MDVQRWRRCWGMAMTEPSCLSQVWNVDYAGCKEGGQVTLWRTTRNHDGLLDSATFPTALWEWLIEEPQVTLMSATLRNRGHSHVGLVVLLTLAPLVVLAIVVRVWVRACPQPTRLLSYGPGPGYHIILNASPKPS